MTQVFLTSASVSPWSLPGDWTNAGHQVELVGCGGNGGAGGVGSSTPGSGGGAGGYYKLTSPVGSLGSTTSFAIAASNSATADQNTSATFWEGTTTTNTYEAQCGNAGIHGSALNPAGGAGVTNGAPSPVTYTAASNTGGTGGAGSTSNFRGAGGGGGAAGPAGGGKTGGAGGSASPGAGGGGGGSNGGSSTAGGAPGAGATGGTGGSSTSGSAGGTGGNPGGSGTLGAGGGGGSASSTTNTVCDGGSATSGDAAFDGSHGAGGGGGGAGANNSASAGTQTANGGNGGNYGGGAGGGSRIVSGTTPSGGTGGGGLIVITYTSAAQGGSSIRDPHLSINPDRLDRFLGFNFVGAPWVQFGPDLSKIFRPILRSLPDQPPQPLLQQSPFPNLIVGTLTPPVFPAGVFPGNPVYELPFDTKYKPDHVQLHSWTWSYNLNLIGKDRLPAGVQPGEPVYDRPQLAVPPPAPTWTWFRYGLIAKPFAQYDWPNPTQPWRLDQTWTRGYNLNLIGKDQLPTGDQLYDLTPSQRPPEQVQLHTWIWNYNLNLIGQDRMTVGELVYDLPPRGPQRGLDLSTWVSSINFNLLPSSVPFAQDDWPLPVQPSRLDQTFTRSYNLNLIGQDQLPVGKIIVERPQLMVSPPAPTWIDTPKLPLIAQPFAQKDWPNPVPPHRIEQTLARSYNLNLIGKDALPIGEIVTDLAPSQKPPEQVQLHSWVWWYNLNLIGQDAMLVGQQLTELPPRAPSRVQEVLNWIQSVNIALYTTPPFPINQYYWPNPAAYTQPTLLQTWIQSATALILPPVPVQPPGVFNGGILYNRTAPAALGPAGLYDVTASGTPNLLPPPFIPPGPTGIYTVSGPDVACDYGVSGPAYTRFGYSNVVYPQSPLSLRTK